MKRAAILLSAVGGAKLFEEILMDPYCVEGLVEWGSLTKLATSAIAEQAAKKSLICLDHEVGRYLDLGVSTPVTIKQLLRHKADLPRNHRGMKSGLFSDPYRKTGPADVGFSSLQLVSQSPER